MNLRTPFEALPMAAPTDDRPSLPTLPWFQGTIEEVRNDETNSQPLMLFSVRPAAVGRVNGGRDNLVENVALLQPLFGNIADTAIPATGSFGLPLKGARVLVGWDGSRWVIIGFYTGPCVTPLETGKDPDQRRSSFNPGLETGISRLIAPPGWDVPNLYGFQPGDIVHGAGPARVKVTSRGVIVAYGADCLSMYTSDSQLIERFAGYEGRSIGWWMRRAYRLGNPLAAAAFKGLSALVSAPQDAAVYQCEITETTPYPGGLRPYIMRQRGHLSRDTIDLGRSVMKFDPSPTTASRESQSGDYAVIRDAVVQPTSLDPTTIGTPELKTVAHEVYDYQVDADGSVRLRAGNSLAVPGGQGPGATKMDFSFEYDAKKKVFLLRIGPGGSAMTKIEARGDSPATAAVDVSTGKLTAVATDSVEIQATKKVAFKATTVEIVAPSIKLTGAVEIDGTLEVSGEAIAQGIPLSTHMHPYTDDGSPVITGVPTP